MEENELVVSLSLPTSDIDIIIKALDERAYHIYNLKDYIFKETRAQVEKIQSNQKEEKNEE